MRFLRPSCRSVRSRIPSGSGQRGAEPSGCHPYLASENRRQMALVGEANFQGNRGERLAGPPHQNFCPRDPAFHDVALGTDTDRLFERAAEVVRAQTGHSGEIRQGQPIIQMCLDVVAHPLLPLA
jgi:hypothetical protein